MTAIPMSLQRGTHKTVPHAIDRHVELFAGAGGLAIGCRLAGLEAADLYEADKSCCATLRHNLDSEHASLTGAVHHGPVEAVNWAEQVPARVLAGGAPCQPFSIGGRWQAERDKRNLFPEVFRAMRALRPDVLLLENVRGLVRPDFRPYFDYVLAQAADPSLQNRPGDTWQEHMARLQRHQGARGYVPEYVVQQRVVNAADYGVPQLRHRVFIVAVKAGMPEYGFPDPTHSRAALQHAQRTKSYWQTRGVAMPRAVTGQELELDDPGDTLPWVTVRDALGGLPPAADTEEEAEMNHWHIPGARAYHGHLGSSLDWPSKAIKAGVHGVPGGENMFTDDRGRLRYFTLRECARIQSFPDHHLFVGARSQITKQIGNAVPCGLAYAVAKPVFDLLADAKRDAKVRRAGRM